MRVILSHLKSNGTFNNHGHLGAQWLNGRVLDSKLKGSGFEPHRRHCALSLSKSIDPSLVLIKSRKTRPYITERMLMGRKESNQTKQITVTNPSPSSENTMNTNS